MRQLLPSMQLWKYGLKLTFFPPQCPAAVLNSTINSPRNNNHCPKLKFFFILKLYLIKPFLKTSTVFSFRDQLCTELNVTYLVFLTKNVRCVENTDLAAFSTNAASLMDTSSLI